MKRYYIVWNADHSEGYITENPGLAMAVSNVKSIPLEKSASAAAKAFNRQCADEVTSVEEVMLSEGKRML